MARNKLVRTDLTWLVGAVGEKGNDISRFYH